MVIKTKVFDKAGKQGREIELPECFSGRIREDICQRYFEATKSIQPYAPFFMAGKQASASGKIKHARHKWRTAYGKGISRVPRKIFWRRGDQFYWQAAEISSAVKGRRAHPPRVEHFQKKLRTNKKEKKLAFISAISATASPEYLKKRYERVEEISVPLIAEGKFEGMKAKEFLGMLKNMLGKNYSIALREKKKRAGKGKARGRRYKISAGLLLVLGKDEKIKFPGIEIRRASDIKISDLWPLGRLTIYTESAVQELGKILGGEK